MSHEPPIFPYGQTIVSHRNRKLWVPNVIKEKKSSLISYSKFKHLTNETKVTTDTEEMVTENRSCTDSAGTFKTPDRIGFVVEFLIILYILY